MLSLSKLAHPYHAASRLASLPADIFSYPSSYSASQSASLCIFILCIFSGNLWKVIGNIFKRPPRSYCIDGIFRTIDVKLRKWKFFLMLQLLLLLFFLGDMIYLISTCPAVRNTISPSFSVPLERSDHKSLSMVTLQDFIHKHGI